MLTAPAHLRGKMTKHTDPAIIAERSAWALQAGRDGWSSYAVGEALGISQHSAHSLMAKAGWRWWTQNMRMTIPQREGKELQPRIRAKKKSFKFWEKRHGDQMTVNSEADRKSVMSAFINWKRNKPGDLRASSRKNGDEFLITFSGVSPSEANEARIAAGGDI